MKKQEQPCPEEQASPDPADGLQKRRSALIEYFRRYLRLTFEELRAASAREAEGLRGPLLTMRLDEEEIRGWERFRDEFASRAIHDAEALVAAYESLLDEAEGDRLLEHGSAERWRQFFRSPAVDFKDKLRALAELRAALSMERDIAEERRRVLDALGKREEKDAARRVREEQGKPEAKNGKQKEKAEELSAEQENTGRNLPKQENPMMDERGDDAGLEAALRALPGSLIPLYATAVARGAEAVRALTQVMTRRIHHEEWPAAKPGREADRRFVVLWRDESMEAPERALERVQCMAQLGSAQPVVVPQGVSRGSQAAIVRHVHPVLQANAAAKP